MEKYGWDYDKAYQEMKNYNFTTGLVHGALKSYVKDYSRKVKPAVQTASAESPATATSN